MALKAVHVSDVPNLDQVPENASLSLYSTRFPKGMDVSSIRTGFKVPKFLVIGHRGSGMNILHSSDRRMKALKENSILSFNAAAANSSVDFIEFDVQVNFLPLPGCLSFTQFFLNFFSLNARAIPVRRVFLLLEFYRRCLSFFVA
jgi:hypothetical protein